MVVKARKCRFVKIRDKKLSPMFSNLKSDR